MRALKLSIALLAAGCGGGAQFTTQTASDFVPAQHAISVLGVYKDGRMALGSWEKLAPHLVQALGPARCDVAFDSLTGSNQDLANAIDEYSRDEGPTAKLLEQLAPAARGDLLLVVTLAGRPPERRADGPSEGAPVRNGMATQRKRHRRAADDSGASDPNRFEISASLFSVTQNRPVALISMSYGGQSADDAMTRFGAELARSIPSSKCAGWNWNVKIDPTLLRTSVVE